MPRIQSSIASATRVSVSPVRPKASVGESSPVLVTIGMSIGLVLALALSRVMTRFLFGVSPLDALTFIGMTALLAAVALTASYLPTRHAAAANPTSPLRHDG